MKEDEITEENIARMVHAFYDKVRADEVLGPVFDQAIGDDDASWQPHLQIMVNFWSSMMLSSGVYHGNPMQKHMDLPPFDINLFDRWLALFEATVRAIYPSDIANDFIDKGQRVSRSLKLGLYDLPRSAF